jgi:DNA repair exonuclease SbcCD nuclease subunit
MRMELGMKLALISDTHAGVRNSSDIFINYQEAFYRDVFFPYLIENNIKQIVHLGDAYEHRRFINFKALNANRKHFLEKLREYGITMDIILGNHDVYYKSTNDLNSLKELMGHYMNEVNIITKPTVMEYDGTKIGLVPWIAPDIEKETMKFLKNCKCDIIMAHLELSGFDVTPGQKMVGGMDPKIFANFEMVLSGHYHTKSSSGNITYLGAQMEFFFNDANDPKYFHIFDTDTRELLPVRNPITMFEKIYYDDTQEPNYMKMDVTHLKDKFVKIYVINKSNPFVFERFVDKVQAAQVFELKIAENFQEFVGESVSDENITLDNTETLLSSYVDNIETELDKNKLKRMLNELMIEAEAMGIE